MLYIMHNLCCHSNGLQVVGHFLLYPTIRDQITEKTPTEIPMKKEQ